CGARARAVRRAGPDVRREPRSSVSREGQRRRRLHQRWVLRPGARSLRLHRGRQYGLGANPARAARPGGQARRVPAPRLLAVHGYVARQERARGSLAEWRCTMEGLVITPDSKASGKAGKDGKGPKVLVTGADGYIGSILCPLLAD